MQAVSPVPVPGVGVGATERAIYQSALLILVFALLASFFSSHETIHIHSVKWNS